MLAQLLLGCVCVVWCGFINSGTPIGVPPSFDCAARQFAWEYGKQLLPGRKGFRTLFDALQLQACNATPPALDHWEPPTTPLPTTGTIVYCDATHGKDTNPGTVTQPIQTIRKGVSLTSGHNISTLVLRAGTYHVTQTLLIGPANSGLTIRNYPGEHAVVSGGAPLTIPLAAWKPYKVKKGWTADKNQNNVYGRVSSKSDSPCCKYCGTFNTLQQCEAALNTSTKGPFLSYTWHEVNQTNGVYAGQCFGVIDHSWAPHAEVNIISGQRIDQNTWVASTPSPNPDGTMPALRLHGRRSIRAKYPNGDPELSGEWFITTDPGMGGGHYIAGWVTSATQWTPPDPIPHATDFVAVPADWPGVDWPAAGNGAGGSGPYTMGMGGACEKMSPPFGYWCSNVPPRGGQYRSRAPAGVHYSGVLPQAATYAHPEGAVVRAWRGHGRWYSWAFLVDGRANGTLTFSKKVGGNQGGEGSDSASEWWIENVLEECDSPNEFFYDEDNKELYYNFNGTGPTGNEEWVVPVTTVIFNFEGTQANPVRSVGISGVEIRDARPTDFAPHGIPSAGDWTLTRLGAVVAEGVEGFTFQDNLVTRVDGNGVMLSGYVRKATISNNEFSWIGNTAMASWGHTSPCMNANCSVKLPYKLGPDGRSGEQPRGTVVEHNLVREVGIWEKQSSMWFQAVTTQTLLKGNVHFNGPRAGVNWNDNFGGGDIMSDNLILNSVRESGDHGPFNSWARVPYITTIRNGKPSTRPANRTITRNFIIGTYSSQECIDNDDGSDYYNTFENFFVYATNGLKSDFGGHDNHHYGNVYAYLENCFGQAENDAFFNNTCVTRKKSGGYNSDCHLPSGMKVYDNHVYTPSGELSVCGTTMEKWVKEGHDKGSTIGKWPADDTLIAAGRRVLRV